MISLAFAGPVALAIISLLVALIALSARIDRLEARLAEEESLTDRFREVQLQINTNVREFQDEQLEINKLLMAVARKGGK